ncbi:hypothetical protein GOV14_06710 [Candidatus Pacearchaeota archaeon]|nr:hypothetical protein [Candidatus Pacearchaeota archaeon]
MEQEKTTEEEIREEIHEAEQEIANEVVKIKDKVSDHKITSKQANKKIDKEVSEIAQETMKDIEKVKKPKKQMKSEKKPQKVASPKSGVIAIIRISGMVKVKDEIASTLSRLRLRRKYACTLIDSTDNQIMKMLEKVKYYVAYGLINEATLSQLIKERARKIGSSKKPKLDENDIMKKIMKGDNLKSLGLKPFFRLHPPRRGIKSKLQYPKGVLGNNKEDINKLIARML